MHPSSIKNQAIIYRKQGYSYNFISQKLFLPKSTISDWVKNISFVPNNNTLSMIKGGNIKSAKTKKDQKNINISNAKSLAKKDIGNLTQRDFLILCAGLYWAEGDKASKEGIRLSNSDPQMIKTIITCLKNICGLSIKNFTLTLFVYPDNNITESINYWSNITKIPPSQFGKTQIDVRTNKTQKRKGKLPYGTVKLSVKSNGNKKFGVFLYRRIIGWIENISNQI